MINSRTWSPKFKQSPRRCVEQMASHSRAHVSKLDASEIWSTKVRVEFLVGFKWLVVAVAGGADWLLRRYPGSPWWGWGCAATSLSARAASATAVCRTCGVWWTTREPYAASGRSSRESPSFSQLWKEISDTFSTLWCKTQNVTWDVVSINTTEVNNICIWISRRTHWLWVSTQMQTYSITLRVTFTQNLLKVLIIRAHCVPNKVVTHQNEPLNFFWWYGFAPIDCKFYKKRTFWFS